MRKIVLTSVVTVLVLTVAVLAACAPASYSSGSSAPAQAPTLGASAAPTAAGAPTAMSSSPASPASAASSASEAETLKVAENVTLGKFLSDEDGHTLYVFGKDTKNTSNCYSGCATTWPPVTSQSKAIAGDGVDAALIGMITRTDGSTQVTYNGMPLYYFASDKNPGDTNGQGFAGIWFVVGPDGSPAKGGSSSSASAPAAAPTKAPASSSGY